MAHRIISFSGAPYDGYAFPQILESLASCGDALAAGVEGVETVGSAKVGDKTLIDAAEKGWKSTKDLQARIGRDARLGERSIGVLDAGSTSCFQLLKTLGTSVQKRLG